MENVIDTIAGWPMWLGIVVALVWLTPPACFMGVGLARDREPHWLVALPVSMLWPLWVPIWLLSWPARRLLRWRRNRKQALPVAVDFEPEWTLVAPGDWVVPPLHCRRFLERRLCYVRTVRPFSHDRYSAYMLLDDNQTESVGWFGAETGWRIVKRPAPKQPEKRAEEAFDINTRTIAAFFERTWQDDGNGNMTPADSSPDLPPYGGSKPSEDARPAKQADVDELREWLGKVSLQTQSLQADTQDLVDLRSRLAALEAKREPSFLEDWSSVFKLRSPCRPADPGAGERKA